jgi:hypothetical protein
MCGRRSRVKPSRSRVKPTGYSFVVSLPRVDPLLRATDAQAEGHRRGSTENNFAPPCEIHLGESRRTVAPSCAVPRAALTRSGRRLEWKGPERLHAPPDRARHVPFLEPIRQLHCSFPKTSPQRNWLRLAGPIGHCQLEDTCDGILPKRLGKNIVAAEPDDFLQQVIVGNAGH